MKRSLAAKDSNVVPLRNDVASQWDRAILHVDMDAFFVNVHLLDHPHDAGVPLVVGGRPENRGVVSSASYEARQFGVRSAMPTSRALRACPQLKVVSSNWKRISQCSAAVMDILAEYGPLEKTSVDEAYVDVSNRPNPEALAIQLQHRIQRDLGLPASIGLAANKLVAKVASDHDKPRGCTIVTEEQSAEFLRPLPVRAINGIGPRTAERLAGIGIDYCGDLAVADPIVIRTNFGRHAEGMIRRAQGIDNRAVQEERGPAKSISQEHTFNNDVGDAVYLREKIVQLSEEVANSLQKRHMVARTVTVKFRLADFTTYTRQRSVDVGIDSTAEIARLAIACWEAHWPPDRRMRLIGVGVSKLGMPKARQLELGLIFD